MKKRLPTPDEIRAWFLHDRIDRAPATTPKMILKLLYEFGATELVEIYQQLYKNCPDFRKRFFFPSESILEDINNAEDTDEDERSDFEKAAMGDD